MPDITRQHRTAEVDFKGKQRSNATSAATTDPVARLYKKSPASGAILCFIGHALVANRSGLIVQGNLTEAASRQIAAQSLAGQWMAVPNGAPRWASSPTSAKPV